MTQLTDNLFAVEVPSMAFGLMVNNYANESELMYMLSMEDIADDDNTEETLITKKLPPGKWQFICTTKEVSEEQAHQIVESVTTANELPVYRDYEFSTWMKTAVGSLHSLLTSKGLDGRKNYALLKKG